MKQIKLVRKDLFALVDDADFEELSKYKWYFHSSGYATRVQYLGGGRKNQKLITILMHRVINNTPDDMQTDHINRNKLDNRKKNLRTVTTQQNQRNTNLSKNNTSGYIGVYLNKRVNKWMAYIWVNYKQIHLGYFKDIEDAIEVRKQAERAIWV